LWLRDSTNELDLGHAADGSLLQEQAVGGVDGGRSWLSWGQLGCARRDDRGIAALCKSWSRQQQGRKAGKRT
jgi:hypothetical protein